MYPNHCLKPAPACHASASFPSLPCPSAATPIKPRPRDLIFSPRLPSQLGDVSASQIPDSYQPAAPRDVWGRWLLPQKRRCLSRSPWQQRRPRHSWAVATRASVIEGRVHCLHSRLLTVHCTLHTDLLNPASTGCHVTGPLFRALVALEPRAQDAPSPA